MAKCREKRRFGVIAFKRSIAVSFRIAYQGHVGCPYTWLINLQGDHQ